MVLVWRQLRVRYKRTFLGFFWSLFPPVAQAILWLIVVEKFFKYNIPNYSAYLFCNALAWQFINNTLLDGCSVMLFHMPLVKAFPMRREVLPISSVLSNLVHFLLALAVFFIYLRILAIPVRATWLLLPLVIVGLCICLLGLVMALSVLSVLYHDIQFIMDAFVLRALFFLCPVFYFSEMVGEEWYRLYMLNPFATYLTVLRQILLPPVQLPDGRPPLPLDLWQFVVALIQSLGLLVIGWLIFNRYKKRVAEWL
ncbi:MAG: ABC transporter permease [Armatimonadetes bacterium]|nr:ABC transporter permease [Armatimonadota bacterium]MDW8120772.1 ABC transporter permease [Armatimonadota bacterium]